MKKLFLLLLTGLLSVNCVLAQEPVGLEDIAKGWKTYPINNVANGSLGVMLERFDQAWPTWMVSSVRDAMEKGLSEMVLDEETERKVTVDAKNGYAEVSDAGTDGAYMSACVWNRPNGHKLLAVVLGKPTDPEIEFACFYDYDPQAKTLTPEPEIVEMLQQRLGDSPVRYGLPRKGKELRVRDSSSGEVYVFAWDGMRPVFSKMETAEDASSIPVRFKGAQPDIRDFVTAILSQEDTGEGFNGVRQSWNLYRSGMKQMPGDIEENDIHNP